MNFLQLTKKIQVQFEKMCASGKLFAVSLLYKLDENASEVSTGYQLWDLYIKAFKSGDDPVFRHPESTAHTCNLDKNFIKNYGNIVAIVDNKLVSMWDIELGVDNIYYNSLKAMSEAVKSAAISNVFLETFDNLHKCNYQRTSKTLLLFQLGRDKEIVRYDADKTFGNVQANTPYEFWFFHVMLPKQFVDFSGKSFEAVTGELRTTRQLFEKTLSIPLETLELVRDLIQQGSLLRGDMYLNKVLEVIKLKKQYEQVQNKNLWLWSNFQSIPYARFANELIGTTCIELAEGKEINKVCKDFNVRVDPTNYNKAKAPVTKQMIEIAEKQIVELGYGESFERRFATIDDINVNEIKHSNVDNTVEKPVGLFGKAGVVTNQNSRHKRAEFDKVESVTIDKFMSDILPNAQSIEVFMENRFDGNLVSLFTEQKPVKNLFKWDNPFSWTYNGNLSGKSMIKENVKAVGGKTSGAFRCSLQWNDEDTKGIIDLDLHCQTPRYQVYYGDKRDFASTTWLDIDMLSPSRIGIENITIDQLKVDGTYHFFVRNFSGHTNHRGFKAEIEFSGEVFNYEYLKAFTGDVKVATITVSKGSISIEHHLPESSSSKVIWGLNSGEFHKVNLVCTSPNHWGDNNIGTKEYFFMLQDCKTDVATRGFHVDQLNSELMSVRKAIDLLGNYKMVEPADKQLSGLGFNSTTHDEIIIKVKGSHQRVLRIQF